MRRRLIISALRRRFDELWRERLQSVVPERFGSMSPFVAQAQRLIADASCGGHPGGALSLWAQPHTWMETETNCLTSLRALALGQQLNARPAEAAENSRRLEAKAFVALLEARKQQPHECFQSLAERYAYPLNITLEGEEEIREYLLMRLMVQDRARLLQRSVKAIASDELLLKLCLVALHAALATDLRYLDALNYYYELLPPEWEPDGEHAWLSVSYLTLYAHALAAQAREERECV